MFQPKLTRTSQPNNQTEKMLTAFAAVPLLLLLGVTNSVSQLVKRADDTNPLTSVVEQLSAEIAELKAQQAADEARLGMFTSLRFTFFLYTIVANDTLYLSI